MAFFGAFPPYVPVAERRRKAAREAAARKKKGLAVEPVVLEGRALAKTFWGKAWCQNLERYVDYASRLPRGRSYVRGGAVFHLNVGPGRVEALVQGTDVYEVTVTIEPLSRPRWKKIVGACAGEIDSLVELVQGKLSSGVMTVVTHEATGLFPEPSQIRMKCSCPDWADMCKHVAAVLYGTGARLDAKPELLFVLRGVDHIELIEGAGAASPRRRPGTRRKKVATGDLSNVFGIEIDTGSKAARPAPKGKARSKVPSR